MKTIEVVAAIIKKDNEVLATQRGYGDFKGGWEFPGGKIEPGEEPKEALKREIKEELDAKIIVNEVLCTIEHDYSDFHLVMHCYLCELEENTEIILKEHEAAQWVNNNNIHMIDWLPADIKILDKIVEIMR